MQAILYLDRMGCTWWYLLTHATEVMGSVRRSLTRSLMPTRLTGQLELARCLIGPSRAALADHSVLTRGPAITRVNRTGPHPGYVRL
jgi:hypothetical protein